VAGFVIFFIYDKLLKDLEIGFRNTERISNPFDKPIGLIKNGRIEVLADAG
jgi:hypothetical protein